MLVRMEVCQATKGVKTEGTSTREPRKRSSRYKKMRQSGNAPIDASGPIFNYSGSSRRIHPGDGAGPGSCPRSYPGSGPAADQQMQKVLYSGWGNSRRIHPGAWSGSGSSPQTCSGSGSAAGHTLLHRSPDQVQILSAPGSGFASSPETFRIPGCRCGSGASVPPRYSVAGWRSAPDVRPVPGIHSPPGLRPAPG